MAHIAESNRNLMGSLKIKNKVYPIYEGLNIIGRDLKATIPIKETVFSKLHAIISIVDANTHLISDLKSSNGTYVRNDKLIPYKFYTINNEEIITFGDIKGLYIKGNIHENTCVKNIHELPTQAFVNCNEAELDIFNAPTQSYNIHEAETQNECESNSNIHEALTQIVSVPPNKPNLNYMESNNDDIHDALTQVIVKEPITSINKCMENNEDSDDATQDFDIKEILDKCNGDKVTVQHNLPAGINNNRNVTDNLNAIDKNSKIFEDATQITNEKTKLTVEDDDNFDVLSRSEVYDDVFANETFRMSLEKSVAQYDIEVDETIFVESQKSKDVKTNENDEETQISGSINSKDKHNITIVSDSDDDIILSTQDSEMIDKKSEEAKTSIVPESTKKAVQIDDTDSDATDVDEDLLSNKTISSISDANVETEEKVVAVNTEEILNQPIAYDSDDDSEIDLLALNSKSDSEPAETSVDKNKKCVDISKNNSENDSDEILDKSNTDKPIIELEKDTCNLNEKEENMNVENQLPTTNLSNDANKTNDDDNLFLAPTQPLHINSKSSASNVSDDDDDEIYLAPTQKIVFTEETAVTEKSYGKDTNNCNDIYSLPTQKLFSDDVFQASTQIINTKVPLPEQELNDSTDVFSVPTQKLVFDSKTNKKVDENTDDIFMAATQLLPTQKSDRLSDSLSSMGDIIKQMHSNNVSTEELSLKLHLTETEESFSEITRKSISLNSSLNKITSNSSKETENIKVDNGEKCNTDTQLEAIFALKTQKLLIEEDKLRSNEPEEIENNKLKANNGNDADAETQLEVDFALNTQKLQIKDLKLRSNKPKEIENKLKANNGNDADAETQLEVDFAMNTQKLYIEKETSRPDNPLAHMFGEECTEMTELPDNDVEYNENIKNKAVSTENKNDIQESPVDENIKIKHVSKENKNDTEKSLMDENIKNKHVLRENKNDTEESSNDENMKHDISSEIKSDIAESPNDNKINEDISSENKNDTEDSSNDSGSKLKPIFSVVNIKNSKITLKDIQEASTSKIKKSYVKLERIKTEPTRRSNRNKIETPNKVAQEIPKQEPDKNLSTDTNDEENEIFKSKPIKTSRIRNEIELTNTAMNKNIETKLNSKNPKQEAESSKINSVKNTDKIENTEQSKQSTRKSKKLNASEDLKKNNSGSNSEKSTLSSSNSDICDTNDTSNRQHNTRGRRITDYNCLVKGELKTPKKNISKQRASKQKSTTEPKQEEIEHKNQIKKDDILSPKTNSKKSKSDSPDSEDIIPRATRSVMRTKRKNNKDIIIIEDSDDSRSSSVERKRRSKVNKVESSDERETEFQNSRQNRKSSRNTQILKRTLQTEDTRRTDNISNIYLNTPNSKRRKYEPLNVTISNSQSANNSIETINHKVIFTMVNDANLESIVSKLGGTVVDTIKVCTVLVTNKISRSLKFLIAVALGKPIVHINWIIESDKQKKFLDPWEYILEDTESEAKFKMSLQDSLKRSLSKKLFSGEKILLATNKNMDVLKEIIITSGGTCITRLPPKYNELIVVCYEDERAKYSKYLKNKALTVVSAEAIFSSVLQQKLDWNKYLLK